MKTTCFLLNRPAITALRLVFHSDHFWCEVPKKVSKDWPGALDTRKKKTEDETNDVQIEIEKEKEEKKNKESHQQRKQEDSTQGEYAYFSLARSTGGV